MIKFEKNINQGIQGDVMFTRVETLPEKLIHVTPKENELIVAHSETGHHHSFDMDESDVEVLDDPNDPLVGYMRVLAPSNLEHHRSYDTHETINFTEGLYRINRQRERTPEGYRRISD